LPFTKRRKELEPWLEYGMPGWFQANLLPVTAEISDLWARITIKAKRGGVTVGMADGLIGATAIHYGLTVVTRNAGEFAGLRVLLHNPWHG